MVPKIVKKQPYPPSHLLKTREKGYSIIPLKIFINDKGLAKMEIGLGKGKKHFDKRETIKDRDNARDIKRKYGL